MRFTARSRRRCLGVTALLSGLLAWSGQAGELVVYSPQHRPAAELAALAVQILGLDGTAVLDAGSGKLILRGSSSTLEQILEALEALDIPLRRYWIEARWSSREELSQLGLAFAGWLEIGELRLGRVTGGGQKGVFRTLRTEHDEDVLTSLLVREGHSAEIWTGTSHSLQIDRILTDDLELQLQRPLSPLPIRSGFLIRPRGLPGGAVELEISSLTRLQGASGELHERALISLVRLAPGEDLVIGGVERESSRSYRGPFGRTLRGTGAGEGLLWIRVSAAEPDPQP